MLDVAWPELFVVGAVALVAIGPKDLPKAMYAMGRWAGRVRAFMNEARHMMDQVAYEADIAQKMKKDQQESEEDQKNADASR